MKNQSNKVPSLSLVEKPKKVSRPREKKAAPFWSIKTARGISGGIFGSSASGIAYLTMHNSLTPSIVSGEGFTLRTFCYGVVLAGCLLFSFPTAYEYFMRAFRDGKKAFGLVVLFELTMLSSNLPWLSVFCCLLLCGVNGFNAAFNSMAKYQPEEKAF